MPNAVTVPSLLPQISSGRPATGHSIGMEVSSLTSSFCQTSWPVASRQNKVRPLAARIESWRTSRGAWHAPFARLRRQTIWPWRSKQVRTPCSSPSRNCMPALVFSRAGVALPQAVLLSSWNCHLTENVSSTKTTRPSTLQRTIAGPSSAPRYNGVEVHNPSGSRQIVPSCPDPRGLPSLLQCKTWPARLSARISGALSWFQSTSRGVDSMVH
ncbi:MAG: hypothetical protein BWY83_02320 [bacterium ADurb.Bin478]|nr:MAG: hypothetical protein BWY83_02320 [bacterium ADurb.Bin478]